MRTKIIIPRQVSELYDKDYLIKVMSYLEELGIKYEIIKKE